jgi:hypothetical protein
MLEVTVAALCFYVLCDGTLRDAETVSIRLAKGSE